MVADSAQRSLDKLAAERKEQDTKDIVAAFHRYLCPSLWERLLGRLGSLKTYYKTRAYEQTAKVEAWHWYENHVKPKQSLFDGPYSDLNWVGIKTVQMDRLGVIKQAATIAHDAGSQVFLTVDDVDLFYAGLCLT